MRPGDDIAAYDGRLLVLVVGESGADERSEAGLPICVCERLLTGAVVLTPSDEFWRTPRENP